VRTGFRPHPSHVSPGCSWGSAFVTGAFVIAFLAWFAIVVTARSPKGLLRLQRRRSQGFIARAELPLSTCRRDEVPPFGLGEAPDYTDPGRHEPPLGALQAAPRPAYA